MHARRLGLGAAADVGQAVMGGTVLTYVGLATIIAAGWLASGIYWWIAAPVLQRHGERTVNFMFLFRRMQRYREICLQEGVDLRWYQRFKFAGEVAFVGVLVLIVGALI